MLDKNLLDKIYDLVKKIKIKSLKLIIDGEEILIDYRNIDKYFSVFNKNKILLSKKNFKLFLEEEQKILSDNCLEEVCEHKIFLPNGKLLLLNSISLHAIEQFIKRYISFFKKYGHEVKLSKETFEKLILIYESSLKLKNKKVLLDNKEYLEGLIFGYLKDSHFLHENNMGRVRDKKEFAKRDKRYNSSIRLLNHPLLFIIDDRNIVTIELYSSSFQVKNLNKNTSL